MSDKDPAAVSLGRRGGLKGGPARAAAMSPEQRSDAARRAANARWGNWEWDEPRRITFAFNYFRRGGSTTGSSFDGTRTIHFVPRASRDVWCCAQCGDMIPAYDRRMATRDGIIHLCRECCRG